jgi:hypothetical protein
MNAFLTASYLRAIAVVAILIPLGASLGAGHWG